MGFLVRLFLALVIAVIIGAASAWLSLDSVAESSFAANGAWRISPDSRDSKLGLYERAALARANLLAPDSRDSLDLIAFRDEAGAPLDGSCTYRIEGSGLPARAWSLAAYSATWWPSAPQGYAMTDREAANADGSYVIYASAKAKPDHWLALNGARKFALALTLYGPQTNAVAAPSSFNAPRIIKETCK